MLQLLYLRNICLQSVKRKLFLQIPPQSARLTGSVLPVRWNVIVWMPRKFVTAPLDSVPLAVLRGGLATIVKSVSQSINFIDVLENQI